MKKIIIKLIKKYKISIILMVLFIGLNIYFSAYPPKIIGEIVDLLYNIEGNKQLIIKNTVYLLVISIVLLIVRMPWRWLSGYIPRSFEKDMKNELFGQFMKMKMSNIQNIKNGELMSYLTKDIAEIRAFTYRILSYGSRIIFTSLYATYVMMAEVNIELTLITLCPIVVTMYITTKIKKYVEKSFKKSQKCFTAVSEYVQESTDAIRTTKSYSVENEQSKEFVKKNKLLKQSNNEVDIFSTLLSATIEICFGLCYGIALIYGSKLVLDGKITVGDLIAFNGYIGLFIGPVSWIPSVISRYKRAQISYERLDNVFKLEREKIDLTGLDNNEKISGDICINNLSFNYSEKIDTVLKNINLEIKEGQTLGIIGTIGSGKTTLANLLLRLYPVHDGKITIGGKDINEIPLEVLRQNICYITQDHFLFSTTIKDNITLFREEFDEEEIKDSIKNAIIHDDIEKMQNGIDTVIGERGIDLSGGQKQRVVISRAFLLKSNIVIFDDTFSALDNKTEEKVLNNVRKLTEGKTCIIISNRISDIKDADNIVVLDLGEIIEQGKHEDLLKNNGLYNKFYMQQSSKEEML